MSISPALELQGLVYDTLKANAAVMALINNVYDTVPTDPWGAHLAYISFGPSDIVEDYAECIDAETHHFQLDVWTRNGGRPACAKICTAVKSVLHLASLSLATNGLMEIALDSTRIMRDPDGLTIHGAMGFTAMIEEL